MSIEELITNLSSTDTDTRRQAMDDIDELSSSNTNELIPHIPSFLEIIRSSTDEYVLRNLGSMISTTGETVTTIGTDHFDGIISTIQYLVDKYPMEEEHDSPAGLCALHLLNTVHQPLTTDQQKFIQTMPLLFQVLEKKHAVRYSAIGVVGPMTNRNPRIFADYTANIFQLVQGGFSELTSILMELYKFSPDVYEQNLEFLIQLTRDLSYQSLALMILNDMAKSKSELLNPYIDDLKETLHSPQTASTSIMVFGEIARNNPELIYDIIPEIQEAMKYNDTLKMMTPNVLGLVGRMNTQVASEILTILMELLDDPDQNIHTVVLMEVRNLGEMDWSVLEPYKEKILSFEDDPQEYIRDQAKFIIDLMEGRDIRTMAANIEAQNKKISEMVHSVDDLKAYVDDNVTELKDFIAEINKKLPVPSEFSTEGRIRKTMKLHFVCSHQDDRCLYPKDRSFATETKAWSKWLKVALSAVKIGKAVIAPMYTGDAVSSISDAYNAYKTQEDSEFISYISQPFLTSEEQDNLVNQLRETRYFDMFNYDAQKGAWACIMCLPPGT